MFHTMSAKVNESPLFLMQIPIRYENITFIQIDGAVDTRWRPNSRGPLTFHHLQPVSFPNSMWSVALVNSQRTQRASSRFTKKWTGRHCNPSLAARPQRRAP